MQENRSLTVTFASTVIVFRSAPSALGSLMLSIPICITRDKKLLLFVGVGCCSVGLMADALPADNLVLLRSVILRRSSSADHAIGQLSGIPTVSTHR